MATGPYRPSSAYLWNALYGFGGDDTPTTGAEGDLLVGGTGNDTYYIDYYSSYVIEQAGEGTDAVYTSKEFVLGLWQRDRGRARLRHDGRVLSATNSTTR